MKIDLPSLCAGLLGGVGIAGLFTVLPIGATLGTASSVALLGTAALVRFGLPSVRTAPRHASILPPQDVSLLPYEWLHRLGAMRDGLDEETVRGMVTGALKAQVTSTDETAPHPKILHHVLILRREGDHTRKDHPSRILMAEVAEIVRTKSGNQRTEALQAVADRLMELPDMMRLALGKNATPSTRLLKHLYDSQMRHGIFPTAEFTWLKQIDRTLWYALNNLGRRTFHVEGLGPIAHYRAEKSAGGPLPEPEVGEAVEAMMSVWHRLKEETRETFASEPEVLPA